MPYLNALQLQALRCFRKVRKSRSEYQIENRNVMAQLSPLMGWARFPRHTGLTKPRKSPSGCLPCHAGTLFSDKIKKKKLPLKKKIKKGFIERKTITPVLHHTFLLFEDLLGSYIIGCQPIKC